MDIPQLSPGCVHVWPISSVAEPSELEILASLLNKDDIERAARFHFERDRAAFVTYRAALYALLASYLGVSPGEVQLRYGPYGKPMLDTAGPTPIRFSVSHSGAFALLAFAVGREIGIDIEHKRSVDFLGLAERCFSERERATLAEASPEGRADVFYEFWTCKEACIKADGRGLSLPLDEFSIVRVATPSPWREIVLSPGSSLPPEMHVRILDAYPGYAAAVAGNGAGWAVRALEPLKTHNLKSGVFQA